MRGILILLLLIFPAALLAADSHRVIANGQVDFSAFKTFVVRQGYPTSRQPGSGNQGTKRTPDVDPKLTQAVRDALRSRFPLGIKETRFADLIVNFRIEVAYTLKSSQGSLVWDTPHSLQASSSIDLTAVTDTIIWHGQYIDDEETSAKVRNICPKNVKKLLSEYPPKKKR